MSYESDRQWADGYVPQARRIIGEYFVREATIRQDTLEATDLIVFTVAVPASECRVAFRVRRPGFADTYPFDFTLRYRRDNGVKTEWQKIIEDGWGDWLLYAHAHEQAAGEFSRWMLVDLHVLRRQLADWAFAPGGSEWCRQWCKERSNRDGTHFRSCDVRGFPMDLVLESSHEISFELPDFTPRGELWP